MERATTGIVALDAQFGGGVPVGTTILSIADPSEAPYILNEQFAAGGLNTGQKVYFYSLQRPKAEVVRNIQAYLSQGQASSFVFFDAYALRLKDLPPAAIKKIGAGAAPVKVPEDVIKRMLKEDGAGSFRVIVESLDQVVEAYGDKAALRMVEGIVALTRISKGVSLLTLGKGLVEPRLETQIQHMVDGILEFGVDRQGFGLYSHLSIRKMRGVPDATKLMLYKETDKGLWLESTRRVS